MQMIVHTLAAMWVLGTLAVAVQMSVLAEGFMGKAVYACIAVPCWAVVGIVPCLLTEHANGPELTRLLKSDWQCAQSHQEMRMAGKVMQTVTVCDAYTRKQTP